MDLERALRHPARDPRATLNHVADRFDLRRQVQFDTRVTSGDVGRRRRPLDRHHRSGRHRVGAVLRHGGGLPLGRQGPRDRRHRHLRGPDVPHGSLAPRGGRLLRSARGRHRHRLVGHPVDPAHRASRPTHLTVFQRTPNFAHAGPQPVARRGLGAGAQGHLPRPPRGHARVAHGRGGRAARPVGPGSERRGARGHLRGRVGVGHALRAAGLVQRPAHRPGANETAAEFVRRPDPRARSTTPRSPSCSRPGPTRSAPSGPASTPTTTPRSTVRT